MPFLVWLDTQEAVFVHVKCCLQEQTRLVRVSERSYMSESDLMWAESDWLDAQARNSQWLL